MTAASYDEVLRADGFTPGLPRRNAALIQSEDSALCAQGQCGACGHLGLDYQPYTDGDRRLYRAVAVCPGCNQCTEF